MLVSQLHATIHWVRLPDDDVSLGRPHLAQVFVLTESPQAGYVLNTLLLRAGPHSVGTNDFLNGWELLSARSVWKEAFKEGPKMARKKVNVEKSQLLPPSIEPAKGGEYGLEHVLAPDPEQLKPTTYHFSEEELDHPIDCVDDRECG